MDEVKVTINLLMKIPDSWKLVNHPDGTIAMDIGEGKFMTMTYTPVIASQATNRAEWTDDYDDACASSVQVMGTKSGTKMQRLRSDPS